MVSIVPMLMFVTPVFYAVSDVPGNLRPYVYLNLIGNYVEMVRDLVLRGDMFNPFLYLGTVAASLLVFVFGYRFFMRYKAIFVDVI
jgi:lipopolysaccharide transport system permease protein